MRKRVRTLYIAKLAIRPMQMRIYSCIIRREDSTLKQWMRWASKRIVLTPTASSLRVSLLIMRLPSSSMLHTLKLGSWAWEKCFQTFSKTQKTLSEKSSPSTIMKLKLTMRSLARIRVSWVIEVKEINRMMMMIDPSITPRTCQWGGMENLFPIGCTNCMDLDWSSSVRFAVGHRIGDVEPLKNTSRSGDTPMEWSAWRFLIQFTLRMWLRSSMLWDSTRRYCKKTSRVLLSLISKRNLKMKRETSILESSILTWRDRVWSKDPTQVSKEASTNSD